MKKLVVFAVMLVMLFTASIARSQGCQPTNVNFQLNPMDNTMFNIVDYTQLPSNVIAPDMTVNLTDGSQNHNVTIGYQQDYPQIGATYTITWSQRNGVSGSVYYIVDGDTTNPIGVSDGNPNGGNVLGGGSVTYTAQASDINHIRTYYYVLFDQPNFEGNFTIDRLNVNFVGLFRIGGQDPPLIQAEDEQNYSFFLQATSTISGSSTMNNPGCPGAINSHHQADIWMTVINNYSAEAHATSDTYGNVVSGFGTSYPSSSVTTYLSFLPGDTVTVSRTGRVLCTIAGIFAALESDNSSSDGVRDPCDVPGGDGKNPCIRTFRTKSVIDNTINSTTTPVSATYFLSPHCFNVQVPTWDPSFLTVTPAFAIPPRFLWSSNTAFSSPTSPGWNFYHAYADKVTPALFPGLSYCSNYTAPY